jgi:hypothetical protein
MARSLRTLLVGVVALVAVSFALHYVLFGSLPIGTPQLLEDESVERLEEEAS